MKKKITVCLIMSCIAVGLWGCSARQPVTSPETEEGLCDQKIKDRESEASKENNSGGPKLGQENEWFTYLYDVVLIKENFKNPMENETLTVYMPRSDSACVIGAYAGSAAFGVDVMVELEPYITFDSLDYSLEKNLKYYVNYMHDPYYVSDRKDLVISEVESINDNSVRITAEYCLYYDWSDRYVTVFSTYYMTEIEGKRMLIVVTVSEDEITEETPELLAELEEFYQFEINWDADRAEQKRIDYLAGDIDNTYSTGYMLFELPENWRRDLDSYDGNGTLYTPGGDIETSGCGIWMMSESVSDGDTLDISCLMSNNEEMKEYLEEMIEGAITDMQVERCETCLGTAAKYSFIYSITIEDKKYYTSCELYYIPSGYDVYMVYAARTQKAVDDPFAVVRDILKNGQPRR